jgi:cytochrome c biogenesis protein CcdA
MATTAMNSNMKYSLNKFQEILFYGFEFTIPEKTVNLINELASQVGSQTFVRNTVFSKKEHAEGVVFGLGWTPCIGPILGSILAFASLEDSIYKGISLLSFYSLGLAIPFIFSSLLIKKFLFFSNNIKKYINKIKKISGVILLITGILIVTEKLQILGFYLIEYFPILQKLG